MYRHYWRKLEENKFSSVFIFNETKWCFDYNIQSKRFFLWLFLWTGVLGNPPPLLAPSSFVLSIYGSTVIVSVFFRSRSGHSRDVDPPGESQQDPNPFLPPGTWGRGGTPYSIPYTGPVPFPILEPYTPEKFDFSFRVSPVHRRR